MDTVCDECTEDEDFDWSPVQWEHGAPIKVCHEHGLPAPGWAYLTEEGAR